VLLDFSPLRKYRDYRLLYFGQFVSAFGSMISYVAVPYQVYELTKNSFYVGLLGAVQVVPVLVLGLWGGALADRMDRRRLLLTAETLMCFGTLALFGNACLDKPNLVTIFVLTGFLQAVTAFHRPALEAITQKLVAVPDYPSVAALSTVRGSATQIVGPALGGLIMAAYGTRAGYAVNFLTYFGALISLYLMNKVPPPERKEASSTWEDMKEALAYAGARPVLIGTYVVDIVAMLFAFPTALFPAMGDAWGGASATGILYSGIAVGALAVSLFSGRSGHYKRHGAIVLGAAALWGVSIVGFGLAPSLWTAFGCLVLAGAADGVSAIYRFVIWNETIPNDRRGKLAGLEMISYLTGPLLGNMRAGWMAGAMGLGASIAWGGMICTAGVVLAGFLLPSFWHYRSKAPSREVAVAGT
jgi:MFS family permease